jgi:hypothetical protein
VDGGRGSDTLAYRGGRHLDLTALGDQGISGIERFAMGSGSDSLTLSLKDLLNLSDTSNVLTVDGDGNDALVVGGIWTDEGVAGGYVTYTSGAAKLIVDDDINITITTA